MNALRGGGHVNKHVQATFDKFGRFEPEVIALLPVTGQEEAEQEWLDENWGQPGCLNISKSADRGSTRGRKLSEEHRRNMSRSHTGKVMSAKARARMSASFKGRVLSAETRRKMSEAHKGFRHSEASRAKMKISCAKVMHKKRVSLRIAHAIRAGREVDTLVMFAVRG